MAVPTMRAVRLTGWGDGARVVRIPVPEPQGHQLLLRVEAAGLCRSDLHVMDAPAGVFDYPLPFTLGHEVAGTVVGAGPEADKSWIGESVVVHGVWSCGQCRNCRRGRENYCFELCPREDGRLAAIGNGIGYDGGLADTMIVPSGRCLVRTHGLAPRECRPTGRCRPDGVSRNPYQPGSRRRRLRFRGGRCRGTGPHRGPGSSRTRRRHDRCGRSAGELARSCTSTGADVAVSDIAEVATSRPGAVRRHCADLVFDFVGGAGHDGIGGAVARTRGAD